MILKIKLIILILLTAFSVGIILNTFINCVQILSPLNSVLLLILVLRDTKLLI